MPLFEPHLPNYLFTLLLRREAFAKLYLAPNLLSSDTLVLCTVQYSVYVYNGS
jgi:hypothetical protein